MFKILTLCAALVGSGFAFQACHHEADVPASQAASVPSLEAIDEVTDDTDAGGRMAADVISPANKVYQVFKVTGTFSSTATNTSAALAVTTASIGGTTVVDSLVKSKNGYSLFSVKSDKFGTYLKKTVDKTKGQTYLMKDKDAKVWHKLTSVSANGATFSFLPNYYTTGLTFSTSGGTSATLN